LSVVVFLYTEVI